jgi:hypothetical protein
MEWINNPWTTFGLACLIFLIGYICGRNDVCIPPPDENKRKNKSGVSDW